MFLDAAICLVAALFALAGYRRGLLLELGSVAGFFAGMAVASAYWFSLATALHRWLANETAAAVAAFVILFALGYVVVILVASVLGRLARLLLLGWLDGLGGAAVGLIKAAFVLELALLLLARLPAASTSRLVLGSNLLPWLRAEQQPLLAPVLAPFVASVPILGGLLS